MQVKLSLLLLITSLFFAGEKHDPCKPYLKLESCTVTIGDSTYWCPGYVLVYPCHKPAQFMLRCTTVVDTVEESEIRNIQYGLLILK